MRSPMDCSRREDRDTSTACQWIMTVILHFLISVPVSSQLQEPWSMEASSKCLVLVNNSTDLFWYSLDIPLWIHDPVLGPKGDPKRLTRSPYYVDYVTLGYIWHEMRTHLIPVCDRSGKHRVKEELLLTDEMLFIRRLLSTDDYYRFDSVEEMKAHAIFRNMWVTYLPVYLSSSFMSSSDWRSLDPWAISSLSLYFLFNLSHTSFFLLRWRSRSLCCNFILDSSEPMSLGLTTRDIGAVWDLVTPHSHLMNSPFFSFFFLFRG